MGLKRYALTVPLEAFVMCLTVMPLWLIFNSRNLRLRASTALRF
ncbi:DUF1196 family protein [Vibrio cholerae]|nr:DUF1196 family protein [Vibrio cholerae]